MGDKERKKFPKIVLMGPYTLNTPADEAMLSAGLFKIRELIPNAQIIALSETPAYTAEKHQVESDYSMKYCIYQDRTFLRLLGKSFAIINLPCRIRNLMWKLFGIDNNRRFFKLPTRLRAFLVGLPLLFSAKRYTKGGKLIFLSGNQKRLLNTLSNGNFLFNTGGGNLNSLSMGDLYAYGLNYLIAKTFNKPIILSAQTIGPFTDWFDRRFARYVLNQVDLIVLRDKGFSVGVLKNLGVTKPLIVEAVDDALFLPPEDSKSILEIFDQEKINIRHPLVAMNLQDCPEAHKLIPVFARIADHLIEEMKAGIIFVPMKCVRGDDDRVLISKVKRLMNHKDKTDTIKGVYDGSTLKGILGQMDLVIGTRYHFIVFASSMLVPSIGICLNQYYWMKNKGILEMLGQGNCACRLEEATFDKLKSLSHSILSDSNRMKDQMRNRLDNLKEQDLFAVKYVAKMLKNNW